MTQDFTNHVNILCWHFLVQNTDFIRFWNNITGTVNLTQIGNLHIKLECISPRHKISKTTQDRNIPPPPYPTFPTYCNRCMCASSPMPVTLTKAEASVLPKGFWATQVYRPSSSTRMSENKKQKHRDWYTSKIVPKNRNQTLRNTSTLMPKDENQTHECIRIHKSLWKQNKRLKTNPHWCLKIYLNIHQQSVWCFFPP